MSGLIMYVHIKKIITSSDDAILSSYVRRYWKIFKNFNSTKILKVAKCRIEN